MALTKTRKIGKIINLSGKVTAIDSDIISVSYSKGSSSAGGMTVYKCKW